MISLPSKPQTQQTHNTEPLLWSAYYSNQNPHVHVLGHGTQLYSCMHRYMQQFNRLSPSFHLRVWSGLLGTVSPPAVNAQFNLLLLIIDKVSALSLPPSLSLSLSLSLPPLLSSPLLSSVISSSQSMLCGFHSKISSRNNTLHFHFGQNTQYCQTAATHTDTQYTHCDSILYSKASVPYNSTIFTPLCVNVSVWFTKPMLDEWKTTSPVLVTKIQ